MKHQDQLPLSSGREMSHLHNLILDGIKFLLSDAEVDSEGEIDMDILMEEMNRILKFLIARIQNKENMKNGDADENQNRLCAPANEVEVSSQPLAPTANVEEIFNAHELDPKWNCSLLLVGPERHGKFSILKMLSKVHGSLHEIWPIPVWHRFQHSKIIQRTLHVSGQNGLLNYMHNAGYSVCVADEIESVVAPKISIILTGSHSLCETNVPSAEKQRMFKEFRREQIFNELNDRYRICCWRMSHFSENSLWWPSYETYMQSLKPDRKVIADREMRKNEIHGRKEWVRMVDTAVSREDNAHLHDPFDADAWLPTSKERKTDSSVVFLVVNFVVGATLSGVSSLLHHGTMKTLILFVSLVRFASAEGADGTGMLWEVHNWLPNYRDTGCPNITVWYTSRIHPYRIIHCSNKEYLSENLADATIKRSAEVIHLETSCTVFGQEGYGDCALNCEWRCLKIYLERNVVEGTMQKLLCLLLRRVIRANQYTGIGDVIQQGKLLSKSLDSRNSQNQRLLLLDEENSYRNRFHIATESENDIHNYTSVDYATDKSPEEEISWQSVILYVFISGLMLLYIYLCSKPCEWSFRCFKCVTLVVWILCTLYGTCILDHVLLRCKSLLRLMEFLMKTYNNNVKYVYRDAKSFVPTGEEQCSASNIPVGIQQEDSFKEHSCDAQDIEAAELRDNVNIHPAEQDVKEHQSLQGKPPVYNEDIERERKILEHQQLIEDAYGTKAEVTCSADVQSISGDFDTVEIREFVERKSYILSKDEEKLFEAASRQAASLQATKGEHQSGGVENCESRSYNDVVSHEQDNTDLYNSPDEDEIRDTNEQSNSEVISTDDTHFVTEIGKGTAGELDISVLIPDAKLGASRPLTTNEELDFTETYHPKPRTPILKASMLRMKVVPNQPQNFTEQSDVTSIQNQACSKSWIRKRSNDTFMNLKYKVKEGSYKPVDCTVEEAELETIAGIRHCTWIPLSQLPVPKIEITVAHVPQFEPLMAIIDQISKGTPPTPHISMRYELLRLCTLRSYPKEDKPYVIKLAAAGFYYASDGDGVVCYSCGVRRYNWTAEDKPMIIHKRINPNCKFLNKNEEVNIPVQYFGPFSESLTYIVNIPEPIERPELSEDFNNDWAPEGIRSPAPRPQNRQIEATTNSLGISTAIPKHSQYATKTAREASYNGWPDSSTHTPQELSDSGYFYAGFGDCVRCFYCGIGLRHWTKDDDPWIEHARWSRTCVFLKQKKGEEFINLVQLAVQYSQDNEAQANASAGNQLPAQEIEKVLLSDAAQSVLEMGYQPRIIKNAIEQILRQKGRSKISAQMLMEKVLEIEETENLTNTATSAAAPQSAKAEAQSAKLVDSKSATGGQSAAQTDKVKKDDEGAKSSVKDTDKDNKGHKAKTASKELSDEAKLHDPKSIKAENEQLKEQTLCKVCLDNTVCIVFLPCGHLVTCADCAPAMRKCPICRALVKGTVRTYMS